MEEMVGRIEAMHLELDAGTGRRVQRRLQPLDVRLCSIGWTKL
jgi:hypothetical protein